jgi:hypothetical protein
VSLHLYLPTIMKGWLIWVPDTPTPTPTATPTATPTTTPTATPTSTPTSTPTNTPTATPATDSICILVYNDLNGSGQRDSGEPLLAGATITVTNYSGAVVRVYTTDGVHEPYCFTGLTPDSYRVEEQNPAGYPISTTPDLLLTSVSSGDTIAVSFGDKAIFYVYLPMIIRGWR